MSDAAKIAELNDNMRKNIPSMGDDKLVVTRGVYELPGSVRILAIQNVIAFSDFNEDNDPHGEHDFGSFELGIQKFFWKIDYYDKDMEMGSEDPADPLKTTRVLTIMLASEY